MIRNVLLTIGASALLAGSVHVAAHHAFGAEFDPNRPLVLKGPVVKVEWVNPHAWIHVEHTTDEGSKEVWMVEGGTPNTLLPSKMAAKYSWVPRALARRKMDATQAKVSSERAYR
jgi:hypothetical protein